MEISVRSVVLFAACVLSVTSFHSSAKHNYEVPCHPEQVHIAYGDTSSAVTILWSTEEECSADVKFGTDPWVIEISSKGETIKFVDRNELGLNYLHRVKLHNLQPRTTYFYRPVSSGISSGPFFFRTPPSGQEWPPVFMVYNDLGIQSESMPYLNTEILSGQYTAVLHVGDFANKFTDFGALGNNTSNETCYTKVGDQFMRFIEDIAARVPYMTTPGNSEIDEGTFAHYRHRFSMPYTKWPMPMEKLWYSIDIGPVHFVSYSTEVFFTQQGAHVAEQNTWLKADLKQANDNRKNVPWVVAFGHRPMYCSNLDGDDCMKPNSLVRAGLEDTFFNYGVDVVIQAYGHTYERLWPQYKGIVIAKSYTNPQAPVQIITGATDTKLDVDLANETTNTEVDLPKLVHNLYPWECLLSVGKRCHQNNEYVVYYEVDWSAFRFDNKSVNSFGRLKIVNKTHLFWEQVHMNSFKVLDELWITQESHGPFRKAKLSTDVSKKIETKTQEINSHKTHDVTMGNSVSVNGGHSEDSNGGGSAEKSSISKTSGTFLESANVRIAFGVGGGVLLLIFIITFMIIRSQRRKAKKYRRWDETVDYGRKFYSSGYAHIQNNDKEASEDFEVEVSNGNLPTSKLLSEEDH